jgi:hypothetical protein
VWKKVRKACKAFVGGGGKELWPYKGQTELAVFSYGENL